MGVSSVFWFKSLGMNQSGHLVQSQERPVKHLALTLHMRWGWGEKGKREEERIAVKKLNLEKDVSFQNCCFYIPIRSKNLMFPVRSKNFIMLLSGCFRV